jgi:branched-subunit amino acid ABC-type transport system permease component
VDLPAALRGQVTVFGVGLGAYRLFLIALVAVLSAGLVALVEKTTFGARVRAAVDDEHVSAGLGIPVERVLLIGGASASAAVRAVAPGLFGVPVAIPAPGEYVGLGAARQAAWVLGGAPRPPSWQVRIETTLDPPPGDDATEVLTRYTALLSAVHQR